MCWCRPNVRTPFCEGCGPVLAEANVALTKAKDGAYAERQKCVALIAQMARSLSLPVGLARHDESDAAWERDWMNIVFVQLPTGQVSWHIHDSELPMFADLPPYPWKWDGHSTDEKYRRCLAFRSP